MPRRKIQPSRFGGRAPVGDRLTPSEQRVAELVAAGRTNREIASELFISVRTVETHRANAIHKLGLRSQTEVVRYALRRGILPPDV